ncbi:transcriptional regulator [Sporosarcina sp. FSL K6-1522]|uniref:transcriptional regulator n=1 Tax=Sporosarcina sp. FSL K6-1522 TaxID=2921554 RepID=UPI00315A74D1
MLGQLLVSMECNELLDMMYVDKNGRVSKRRIKVIQVEDQSFKAYCYLRQSKRTFTIDHVLALVPIIKRERDVV